MTPADQYRTDKHNNPTAFTESVALLGKLIPGTEFTQGDSFQSGGETYYTAKLIGDPIELTIRVIDRIGFHTLGGKPRWVYPDFVGLPSFLWASFTFEQKRDVIGFMYRREAGVAMRGLFPNYAKS